DLAGRLAARAVLICCSHAERAFVDEVLQPAGLAAGRILIETRSAKGAALTRDGTTVSSGTAPITVNDPTGAGDTFAGGVLAALAGGETEPVRILDAGHRAAAALLRERRTIEMESA
ncbi:PfkB family carbohydrate kinase, partial [Rhizobiaceae sp. 2RAB30]